jgi:hypothetical protein
VLLALLCAAAGSGSVRCAGPGNSYSACPLDGGFCAPGGNLLPTDFLTSPVTVALDSGWHDGEGDAIAYQGAIYAAFRRAPSGHPDYRARVAVVRTLDKGQTWSTVTELLYTGFDLRSPKLAVIGLRLWVIANAWNPAAGDPSGARVVAAWSTDGSTFSPLALTGLPSGVEAWRPRGVAGAWLMAIWQADDFSPTLLGGSVSLWTTADGASWANAGPLPVTAGGRQPELLPASNGGLWAAVPERMVVGSAAAFDICSSKSSTALEWSCWSPGGAQIDAPALFEAGGDILLAGSFDIGGGLRRTALWLVDGPQQKLWLVAELPVGMGETGAPSMVDLGGGKALLVYQTTYALDPLISKLGHEPTLKEAQSLDATVELVAVTVNLDVAL